MANFQAGILAEVPRFGRYVFFDLTKGASAVDIRQALSPLAPKPRQLDVVVCIGLQAAQVVGYEVAGLREFEALQTTSKIVIPSYPAALLLWLRGDNAQALMLLEQKLAKQLKTAFVLRESVAAFKHTLGKDKTARDLTGYEDGTENPQGAAARSAAFLQSADPVLNGASFLAVQRWQHDWQAFGAMTTHEQDNAIGRRKSDNEELEDAPESAHVRRTAQEDFDPEAFVLRRSMPWCSEQAGDKSSGLMFAAFGKSFNAVEAQMHRMAGLNDGVVDALFQFSKPMTTSYFWCPPVIMTP